MTEIIIFVLNIIGAVSFAISGALVAISCNLDLFGVVFTGCVTAVGGGIIRDIFIGHFPPAIFENSIMLIIAAVTSIAVFTIAYINAARFSLLREKIEKINNVFDAVGLSVFSVAGTQIACNAGFSDNIIFVVLMGMTTGVGGGLCRDILVDKAPYILTKHIYALASIFGSFLYYGIFALCDNTVIATAVAVVFVVSVRMLASIFRWKLPKVKIK